MQDLLYDFALARRGSRPAKAWLGTFLGVVIEIPDESDKSGSAEHARRALGTSADGRARVLGALEAIYRTMGEFTHTPALSPYSGGGVLGLAPVEIPVDNAGAGGLAHHGAAGISVGAALFSGLCIRAANCAPGSPLAVDHVFYYEAARNYWEPRFNRAFDWACDGNEACWGWWTVAFNNFWACVLPEICKDVEMVYFGRTRASFRSRMKRDIRQCVSERWRFDAWTKSRMPWRPNESVNDLMTGLLLVLYDMFGRGQFVSAFFRELRIAKEINSSNAGSTKFLEYQDNFYRISSLAAGCDAAPVFMERLGWSISEEARREVANKVGGNTSNEPLPLDDD